jgi:putative DNA primase/helicase
MVDLYAVIANGRPCPVITTGPSEEETEKRLGALLRGGVPLISLDNASGELGGAALCRSPNGRLFA